MNYIKKAIWGPDPKEQHRKCKALLRKNTRALEKSIRELGELSKKTEKLIKTSYKKNDTKSVRLFAKELYLAKKQQGRLYKSKAQLESVGMQIEESFGMMKLQQSLGSSTMIMKEVNSLVKLPVITGTMRELEKELIKSGIISEMNDDIMDEMGEMEDEEEEEVEEEISKIITSLTSDQFNKVETVPQKQFVEDQHAAVEEEPEEDAEEDQHVLNEMRERLRALQS